MGINPPHSAQFADSLGTGCPLPYRLHGPWMMQLSRRNCRLLSGSRARICISGSSVRIMPPPSRPFLEACAACGSIPFCRVVHAGTAGGNLFSR